MGSNICHNNGLFKSTYLSSTCVRLVLRIENSNNVFSNSQSRKRQNNKGSVWGGVRTWQRHLHFLANYSLMHSLQQSVLRPSSFVPHAQLWLITQYLGFYSYCCAAFQLDHQYCSLVQCLFLFQLHHTHLHLPQVGY